MRGPPIGKQSASWGGEVGPVGVPQGPQEVVWTGVGVGWSGRESPAAHSARVSTMPYPPSVTIDPATLGTDVNGLSIKSFNDGKTAKKTARTKSD